jgi:hypothetical protein
MTDIVASIMPAAGRGADAGADLSPIAQVGHGLLQGKQPAQ